MTVSAARVAAALEKVAREVILPRFGALGADDIRQKSGPNDLVTEVDEQAEAALKTLLGDILPEARFVGEECVAKDKALEELIAGPGAVWVVDPLDGTRNFVKGVPEFGTIVALVVDGKTVGGWIYAIPDGYCASALLGEGALMAGAPVAVAPPKPRYTALRSLGWLEPNEAVRVRARLQRDFDATQSHCSAYAYLSLARGAVDLKLSSRIHAWDHLAGALILSELGGRTAFLDGAPYSPGPSVDRALLATAPGRDWEAVARAINGEG